MHEAAAVVAKRWQERFVPAGGAKLGEESCIAEAGCAGRICLFRKGQGCFGAGRRAT
jgi:hypothetical protein